MTRTERYTQAKSSTPSLRGITSGGIIGVEAGVFIPVYRDVQHVGIFFKCRLNTITLGSEEQRAGWRDESGHTAKIIEGIGDIP